MPEFRAFTGVSTERAWAGGAGWPLARSKKSLSLARNGGVSRRRDLVPLELADASEITDERDWHAPGDFVPEWATWIAFPYSVSTANFSD
jgi:hypothetical protein